MKNNRSSAGTANTPSTQPPSSPSSKRPTCVFEKIRELVWGGPPAPSAHLPEMSGGFMIKLLLNNNSFISYIVTPIWVLEWRSRAERTPSHPTAEPIRWGVCQSLPPAGIQKDGHAHVQPVGFEPKCKSGAELQECVSLEGAEPTCLCPRMAGAECWN